MSIWSTNPASVAATQRAATKTAALEGTKPVILYPNKSGVTTSGKGANYVDPVKQAKSTDPYGGTPISLNINTSDSSAKAIQSLQGTLGNAVTGLSGLGNSLSKSINGISSGINGSLNGLNGSIGNIATALKSLTDVGSQIGSGFKGLQDIIIKNSANNNAWSAKQAEKQMDFQSAMQQEAMLYNSLEAGKNRDWQEYMSNTAHQREVADLQAAGLNPVLSASGGNGAAVTSGATAAGAGVPNGAKGDTDESGNSALAALFGAIMSAQVSMHNTDVSAKTNMAIAEQQIAAQMYGQELAARTNTETARIAAAASRDNAELNARTSSENAALSAEASKYAAGTAYAAAAYGADKSLLNQREQRQWNSDHPSNLYQTGSALFGNAGISSAKSKAKSFGSNVMSWIFDR